jgi:hypothetical protein
MSVLPKAATLTSFFGVAAMLSLVTVLVAVKLQTLISFFKGGVALKINKKPSPTQRWTAVIGFLGSYCSAFHGLLRRSYDRIRRQFEESRVATKSYMLDHTPYIIYILYVFFIDMLLWRLFIKLPLSELDYDLNLFIPRRTNIIHEVKFSHWKCVIDIIRAVFLPLWFVLVILVLALTACVLLVFVVVMVFVSFVAAIWKRLRYVSAIFFRIRIIRWLRLKLRRSRF